MKFVIAALALAACSTGHAAPVCSWDRPGANPYMGEVPSAVRRYREIPAGVREKLQARMERLDYDEMVEIRRDVIVGKDHSYENLRGMHFGNGGFCEHVTRTSWSDDHRERGFVYCEQGHCILVPTVCRNVSRVDIAPITRPPVPPVEDGLLDLEPPWVAPFDTPAVPQKPTEYERVTPPDWGGHYLPPVWPGTPTYREPPGETVPEETPPADIDPPQSVAEPGTASLLLAGALFVAVICSRRRRCTQA